MVEVGVLALHEQVDLLFRHYHLEQIGLQTAGVVEEVDVLILHRGIANEAHVKLAHARVVEVHLRNQNFVDVLEVDAGGETLLGTEQYPIPAVPQGFPQSSPLGEGFGGAGNGEQRTVREIFTNRLGVGVQHILMPDTDSHDLMLPLGCHLHRSYDLQRSITHILIHSVRCGRYPEHQCNLLHQLQHGVLA